MLKHNGKYYFMWSEGDWTGPDYCVAYAIADSPFGPFKRVGKILEQDTKIANGAGHHSIIKGPGRMNGILSIIAALWVKPMGTTALLALTECILIKTVLSNL